MNLAKMPFKNRKLKVYNYSDKNPTKASHPSINVNKQEIVKYR